MEAQFGEAWKFSGVIEVSVAQDDGIERGRVIGRMPVFPVCLLARTLKEATVCEDSMSLNIK